MKKISLLLSFLFALTVFTSCDKDDDKSGSNGGGSSKLPEYAELNGVKYFKFPPMDLYGLNNEICMMEIDEKYPEYVYDSYMGSAAVYEAICKENRNLFYFTNDGYEMSKIRVEISTSVLAAADLAQILYNAGILSDGKSSDGGLKYKVPGDKMVLIITQSGSTLNLDFYGKNYY
jgi:hypothetical protein